MAVPSVNIQIDQGTDFSSTFDLKKRDNAPLDLTNYDFSAKLRKHASAANLNSNFTIIDTDDQIRLIN